MRSMPKQQQPLKRCYSKRKGGKGFGEGDKRAEKRNEKMDTQMKIINLAKLETEKHKEMCTVEKVKQKTEEAKEKS